jgi:hypothetical protein
MWAARRSACPRSAAWPLAVNTDQALPDVRANVRLQGGALADRMSARVARTGCRDPHVINAVFSVASLVKPMTAMMSPAFLLAVLRGPRKPALTSEQAIAQFPEFGDLLPYGASDRPTRNTA